MSEKKLNNKELILSICELCLRFIDEKADVSCNISTGIKHISLFIYKNGYKVLEKANEVIIVVLDRKTAKMELENIENKLKLMLAKHNLKI